MKQNLLFNRASALTKRLAMVLTMLLIVGIGQAWGAEYELVSFSDIKTNDVIIIVGTKSSTAYAMKNTGTPPTPIKLTISNSKITSTATDITFTATNNGDNTITFVSTNSGTLYCTNANNGVKIGSQTGNNTKFSFDSDVKRLKNIGQTRWLGIYNTQDWRCYTSASAANISGTTTTFYRKVTAAPSFTVTAKSNNESWGTVSLEGTIITASPEPGYRVSTTNPYSISPSGSAIVAPNGNTFNVTPSANTTITINFEAIPTHKVYFNTGGLVDIESVDVQEGQTYNITQTPASSLTQECEYNTFAGWTISSTTLNNANECPEIVTSITMSTSDITLYAVYSRIEEVSGGGTTSVTGELSFANTTQRTSFSTSKQVWEQNGITLTNDKSSSTNNVADYANPARFYKSSKITVEAPGNITQIKFNCVSSYVISISGASTSGTTVTVALDGTSDTYTISSLSAQVRLNSLSVTYTTSGGSSSTTYYNSTPECSTETSR